MDRIELNLERLLDTFISKLPTLLLALVTLLIGFWLIKFLVRFLNNHLNKGKIDLSLSNFLISILKVILYILLLVTVASTLGIETSSFVAILAASGLAVGLALQGSLSNFAGGVLILLFKPFKVGHFISSSNNVSGTVLKIDILYTTLKAGNGTTIYAPNGPLANAVINNVSDNMNRMQEYSIGISYNANIDTARKVILNVLTNDPLVLKDPAPVVLVSSLGDNAVNLTIRSWSANADFWATYHRNFQLLKEALDHNNIGIPYPQREIHIIPANTELPD
ncbi:small conductance mechanosensitive channel [Pedobacter cryoconitis]|uniref:Small conductance mechanosensitive channel n=1 Tax=Pedobacter cryoconitis TaxID=188932 RepID=A0A7W8YRH6_9SPHI|nr:mechanosensitive ion channel domain-containing protein [Pedobacter cryoconitis]MBB5620474.1 small conductance mechanosensitive channel [Pedobacter cryoconitis]